MLFVCLNNTMNHSKSFNKSPHKYKEPVQQTCVGFCSWIRFITSSIFFISTMDLFITTLSQFTHFLTFSFTLSSILHIFAKYNNHSSVFASSVTSISSNNKDESTWYFSITSSIEGNSTFLFFHSSFHLLRILRFRMFYHT